MAALPSGSVSKGSNDALPAHLSHIIHVANTGGALSAHDSHVLHVWNTQGVYLNSGAKPLPPSGNTGGQNGVATDPNTGLSSGERDAAAILTNLFESYGLGSLAPQIVKYIQGGYSADAISVLLQGTPEYKQRFAANDVRIKNGLPALSPAQYISAESSYRQIMSAAGLPTGFYDQQTDFTNFIASDISPTELQGRVNAATEAINQAPPSAVDYFKQWYNTGDLIAYALDPQKAAPLVERNIKAAESAGIAKSNNVNLTQGQAEGLGAQGFTLDQTRQGLGFVGQELPTVTKLDQIYGGNVTQDDLVNETFFSDSTATKKRQQLASQERAAFQGSSGANGASLASERRV